MVCQLRLSFESFINQGVTDLIHLRTLFTIFSHIPLSVYFFLHPFSVMCGHELTLFTIFFHIFYPVYSFLTCLYVWPHRNFIYNFLSYFPAFVVVVFLTCLRLLMISFVNNQWRFRFRVRVMGVDGRDQRRGSVCVCEVCLAF